MSEEDRKQELPEEPSETPPVPPEEELGQRLTDQAESVTSETQDLSDTLTPRQEGPVSDEEPIWAPTDAVVPGPEGGPGGMSEPVAAPPAPEATPVTAPLIPAAEQARAGAAFTPEGTDDDRLLSALAWFTMVILQLPIVSIIQLLSPSTKDRPFQRHHAITSLLFYAAAFVYELLAAIVYTVLGLVTLGCGFACLWVIFFIPHLLALYYAFQAYSGKRIRLPGLTDFARQQGWL